MSTTKPVVLITGAQGGLGQHVTEAFLHSGARVIGAARRIASDQFASPDFHAVEAQLTTPEGAELAVTRALAWGDGRLDVVVQAMGAFAPGSMEQTTDEVFSRMLEVNLHAAFYVARAAWPHLKLSAAGRFLAIGSRQSIQPTAGTLAYNISKAGLLSLVQTLAAEAHGTPLTANAVLPGTMDTPANRAAMPEADVSQWVPPQNVAALLLWLASPAAADVNGAAIPIFGR